MHLHVALNYGTTKMHCCSAVTSSVGGLGFTAVFLSHHYSLLFFLQLTLQLCDSGAVGRSTKEAYTPSFLKHTLAVASTQNKKCGSSLNAIRGSEI